MGNAPGVANTLAHAGCQNQMMAIAGRKIGTGLRDADDRPSRLQFFERQPEIQIALQIQRGHVGVVRIVEPCP